MAQSHSATTEPATASFTSTTSTDTTETNAIEAPSHLSTSATSTTHHVRAPSNSSIATSAAASHASDDTDFSNVPEDRPRAPWEEPDEQDEGEAVRSDDDGEEEREDVHGEEDDNQSEEWEVGEQEFSNGNYEFDSDPPPSYSEKDPLVLTTGQIRERDGYAGRRRWYVEFMSGVNVRNNVLIRSTDELRSERADAPSPANAECSIAASEAENESPDIEGEEHIKKIPKTQGIP